MFARVRAKQYVRHVSRKAIWMFYAAFAMEEYLLNVKIAIVAERNMFIVTDATEMGIIRKNAVIVMEKVR